MNPSSPGWIKKKLYLFEKEPLSMGIDDFYPQVRSSGFIYGISIKALSRLTSKFTLTELELTKSNLVDCLYYIHAHNGRKPLDFVKDTMEFYGVISPERETLLTLKGKDTQNLEKIIHSRTQTNEPLLQKNFSHLITNALLFLDIVGYDHYLKRKPHTQAYIAGLEAVIMNTIWMTLTKKGNKKYYDELLIQLFEKSLRYNKNLIRKLTRLEEMSFKGFESQWERRYIMDLASLAVWEDNKVEKQENTFLVQLSQLLELKRETCDDAILSAHAFISAHRADISYLNYSNPLKNFYKQTNRTVKVLVLRNKDRLVQEIMESGELVKLLGQSTLRDLTKEERKKVRTQLLDVCKSIPSLAIFLLPGGSLMLPILIKFIPELLPSAFRENSVED